MTVNQLTSGSSSDDDTLFVTDGFGPTPDALVLVFVTNARQGFGQTAPIPTITGGGSQFQMVTTVVGGERADLRLSCFRAMSPNPAAGSLQIQFGDDRQDLCIWSVVEVTDVDATAANGSNAIEQHSSNTGGGDSLAVVLGASPNPSRNTTIAAVALDVAFLEPGRRITAGAGFAELDQLGVEQALARRTLMQTEVSSTNPGAASWSWSGAESALAVAVEVRAIREDAPELPADPTEALIRRFEPILFLHEDEKFFPSDAKRFIEHAALWGSTAPFGDKTGWTKRVPAGQLVAKQSEVTPGTTSLAGAGNTAATAADVRFLELGGWKNSAEDHEDGVTDTTSNVYADRAEIERLYEGALADSRFWYHAEVYDSARLINLAKKVVAPNLSRILADYAHPTLLCYYFFFPAHEQKIDAGGCPNVEAREAYSHAGDWQCVALLLDGDGTNDPQAFSPRYFGYTGTRPEAADGTTVPLISGDDDRGGYTIMKVARWRAGTATTKVEPDLDGDHPRFYVAKGSHSLYTNNGDFKVAPETNASLSPSYCGFRDDSSPIPGIPGPTYKSAGEHLTALLAKIASTGFFGFAWVGLVAGIVEAISDGLQPFGSDPSTPTPSPVNPEQTPPAGEAVTIKPKGIAVAGSGVVIHEWAVQQGLNIGGRTYDYVVDRGSQIFWPLDDVKSNFRGRWGQHVTNDILDRRNGPHFLQYWKMFLTAMAGAPR